MRSAKRPKGSKKEDHSKSSPKNKNVRKKSNNKKKKGNKFLRGLKVLFISLLLIGLIAGVALAGVGLAMIKTAPPLDIDKILSLEEPARFYDDSGKLIDEYITSESRENVVISQVPKNIQNAFIAIEDERFKEHSGIDWYRFGGAMKSNINYGINFILNKPRGSVHGASTITQQLIKQRLFYESSVTDRLNVERKVQEMYLAWQLDKELSKDKILEAYLNTILLGGKAYGIKAASTQYFGKDLAELTLIESAFLASAAQLPAKSYSLSYASAEENDGVFYSKRTFAILGKMLELGFISESEYEEAIADKVKDDAIAINFDFSTGIYNKMQNEWFSRIVIEAIEKDFRKQGKSDAEIENLLANSGLKIYTTMNSEWQAQTQEILDDKKTDAKTKASDFLFPVNSDLTPVQEELQASAVVIDYRTGEVKVVIGGRGEAVARGYNRAASDDFLRAPGSCIKPLTVYGPAIDSKKLTAGSIIEDSPLNEEQRNKYNVQDIKKNGKILQYPRNAPQEYAGYLTLREGLKNSKNTVAMKVVDTVGLETAAEYGRKFGLSINDSDAASLASMSLGQLSAQIGSGANPLKLASAYGTFGNNGVMTSPIFYTKVVSSSGEILLEPDRKSTRIMSAESSYIMYDLLKEPVTFSTFGRYHGTGTSAMLKDMDTRGKTGTSGDKKDYWFTGFTPYYSCSIWVGNDLSTEVKNGANRMGSYYVGKVWNKVMTPIHEGLENRTSVEMPSNITKMNISMDSGTKPSNLTDKDPRGKRTYEEIFINGTAPTTVDDVHVLRNVVIKDGKEYLPTPYSILGERKAKVYITRESKPFWGADRQSYTLVDEKYQEPKAKDPIDPTVKKYVDLLGPIRAKDYIHKLLNNIPLTPNDPGYGIDDNTPGEENNNGANTPNEDVTDDQTEDDSNSGIDDNFEVNDDKKDKKDKKNKNND